MNILLIFLKCAKKVDKNVFHQRKKERKKRYYAVRCI